jgi:hypothetical protein
MSARRVGLNATGDRRKEVARRAGRKKAFPERKDMIVRVDLQAASPVRINMPNALPERPNGDMETQASIYILHVR